MAFWDRNQRRRTVCYARFISESIDSFERRCAHCREHAFLCVRSLCAAYRSFTWTLLTRLTCSRITALKFFRRCASHFFPKREHRRSNVRRKRVQANVSLLSAAQRRILINNDWLSNWKGHIPKVQYIRHTWNSKLICLRIKA